jgi:hypothetical protein
MGTFTPTESFAAMPSTVDSDEEKLDSFNSVKFGTPPITTEETSTLRHITTNYSPNLASPEEALLSPQRQLHSTNSSELDFPTPRVENSNHELSEKMREIQNQVGGFAPPFVDVNQSKPQYENPFNEVAANTNDPLGFLGDLSDMPLVPSLNASPHGLDSGDVPHSFDAPRSVLLEELHLILQMESGVQGPRWISEVEPPPDKHKHVKDNHMLHMTPSEDSPSKTGGQNYLHPMFGGGEESSWYEPIDAESMAKKKQACENEAKLREASSVMDPADDPRNSIDRVV